MEVGKEKLHFITITAAKEYASQLSTDNLPGACSNHKEAVPGFGNPKVIQKHEVRDEICSRQAYDRTTGFWSCLIIGGGVALDTILVALAVCSNEVGMRLPLGYIPFIRLYTIKISTYARHKTTYDY